MKIVLFLQEVLSVVITPFILWYTLPKCSPAIVDFFREFTVHVDGLGYVCSFAVFDFKRHGDVRVSQSFTSSRRILLITCFFGSLVHRCEFKTIEEDLTKEKWRNHSSTLPRCVIQYRFSQI
jgi:hypothetical protein